MLFNEGHIHPMLVHFPIALTLLGCLLEGIALYRNSKMICGQIILYFATLSAICADFAGNFFTPHFTDIVLVQAKSEHSTMAAVTVTLLCIASAFYLSRYVIKKYDYWQRRLGFLFYILAVMFVSITGYLGGTLVYNDLLKM